MRPRGKLDNRRHPVSPITASFYDLRSEPPFFFLSLKTFHDHNPHALTGTTAGGGGLVRGRAPRGVHLPGRSQLHLLSVLPPHPRKHATVCVYTTNSLRYNTHKPLLIWDRGTHAEQEEAWKRRDTISRTDSESSS